MDFVLLWTDILFYVLILAFVYFVIKICKDRITRANWAVLVNEPKNLIAFTVLLLFVSVALLDSIHIRHTQDNKAPQVVSMLDLAFNDLANNKETTYSAPFAIRAYTQDTVVDEQGNVSRDYPRLKFAGTHLAHESEHIDDIVQRLQLVLIYSLFISVALCIAFTFITSLFSKDKFEQVGIQAILGKHVFPYRTAWLLIFILTFCFLAISQLKPYYHILGTSKVGEDVFYQSIKSIRTGILIGTLTTLLMLPFALILGLSAGYFKGVVDDIIQYTYTTLSAIPGVLLIAAMVLSLQVFMSQHQEWFVSSLQRADVRLLGLCAILGLTSWTGLCRLIRAECLKLSQMDYVQAAVTLGSGKIFILAKHLLPNVMHIVLISIALDFSGLVLAEAVLSYVGVGVDPATYSWGTMINGARLEMAREPVVWWSLLGAFVFMFTLVLCANIFADGVRDASDPRLSKVKV